MFEISGEGHLILILFFPDWTLSERGPTRHFIKRITKLGEKYLTKNNNYLNDISKYYLITVITMKRLPTAPMMETIP